MLDFVVDPHCVEPGVRGDIFLAASQVHKADNVSGLRVEGDVEIIRPDAVALAGQRCRILRRAGDIDIEGLVAGRETVHDELYLRPPSRRRLFALDYLT